MSQKFKYLFLFICSLMLIISCEKEDVVLTETSQDNLRLKEEYITLEDLEAMPQAMEVIRKIEEKRSTSPNERSVYNKDYDFFIDTSRILKINNGDYYHSLTFPVFRLEDNGLVENLVLSKDDDGYSAALYTYKFSPEQRKEVEEGSPVYEAKEVSRKVLNFDTSTVGFRIRQIWYTQIVIIPCSSGQHGAQNFGQWHQCTAGRKPEAFTISRSVLIDDGGNDGWIDGGNYSSSNGGGGGGSGTYNPNIPPFDPDKDMDILEGKITRPLITLPTKEQDFYNNDLGGENRDLRYVMNDVDVRVPLLDYLRQNNYSEESRNLAVEILKQVSEGNIDSDIVAWAFTYFSEHPDVTFEVFENQFLGEAEGVESLSFYNSSYWDNPDLTFAQQSLPTKANFLAAYPGPSISAYQLSNQIGGEVLSLYNAIISAGKNMNTCAVRLSRALNYSGVIIPDIPGKTKLGADGKYYFTFAADIGAWMMFTFGISTDTNGIFPYNSNHVYLDDGGINGENFPPLLENTTGIYVMQPISTLHFGATGHCDALVNGVCKTKCYFMWAIGVHVWILN